MRSAKLLLALGALLGGLLTHGADMILGNKNLDKAHAQGREEGHKDGYRQGQVDAASKFAELLEQSDSMKKGAFAIGVYVARIDGDISDEEADKITDALGHLDSPFIEPQVKATYKEILETTPDFETIKNKYLNCLTVEQLNAIDAFIKDIIKIDSVVEEEEESFYKEQWIPYLNARK